MELFDTSGPLGLAKTMARSALTAGDLFVFSVVFTNYERRTVGPRARALSTQLDFIVLAYRPFGTFFSSRQTMVKKFVQKSAPLPTIPLLLVS